MTDLVPRSEATGLALLAQLESSGAITETSLTLPADLPYDQYEALASMFGQLHRTSQWLIGDLLNFGEKVYGETYAQAAEATGLAPQTLANYSSVCNRIPRSRRRSALNFSVHAEVASRSPEDQKHWLKLAEENRWTRMQLRHELEGGGIRYESVSESGEVVEVEVLPPGVEHVCQCPICGRYHKDDVDVHK